MTRLDVTRDTPVGTLVAHRSADRPGVAPIVEHAGVLDGLDAVVVGLNAVHYCRDLVVVEAGPPTSQEAARMAEALAAGVSVDDLVVDWIRTIEATDDEAIAVIAATATDDLLRTIALDEQADRASVPAIVDGLDNVRAGLVDAGLPAEIVWHGPGAAFVECPLPDGRHLGVDDMGDDRDDDRPGSGILGLCVYASTADREMGVEPVECTLSEHDSRTIVRLAVALRDGATTIPTREDLTR